jgi:hypothetical protein
MRHTPFLALKRHIPFARINYMAIPIWEGVKMHCVLESCFPVTAPDTKRGPRVFVSAKRMFFLLAI